MKKSSILLPFLIILSITLNSCIVAAVGVGGGTVAYVKGLYSMNIEGNYKDVYKAALKAVNDNNDYVLISKDLDTDNNKGKIYGATKIDSTDFYVKIQKVTDKISKVTIKFGNFGDQAMSSTLMDQIQSNANK